MHMAAQKESNLKKWEHPKKSGIWIRELLYTKKLENKEGTYSAFQVTIPADRDLKRARQRKQFTTKSKAEKWASETLLGQKKASDLFGETTAKERNEFLLCHAKLKEHGIMLTEAVEFAIKRLKPKGGERTISEISKELIESKRIRLKRGDLRERSFRDFDHRATKFAEAFEQTPSYDLTIDDLREWLIGLEVTPRTTQNYLSIVSEILKYAVQKKYITASPIDELTDSDRKELCGSGLEDKEPSILSIKQSEKLLEAAKEHKELGLLGAVTIGLFCGIRVEEFKRLDWANVKDSESEPIITLSGSITKKRRIRHVDIPENALKWLSLCKDRTGTVPENKHTNDYQKRFRKLLQLAGFGHIDEKEVWKSDWETNAMRHSFGSYHYALHGNPLETSRQLGHKASDQVLFDHYRALATKEQGEAFFSIVPPKSESTLVEFAG
jgi:integrase/recombinase XerD